MTAIVPILKETYHAKFNGTKKPMYTRMKSELLRDPHVIGILTAGPTGEIPPVTLCEQYNDLRADENANSVYTYVFAPMDASTMHVSIDDPQAKI